MEFASQSFTPGTVTMFCNATATDLADLEVYLQPGIFVAAGPPADDEDDDEEEDNDPNAGAGAGNAGGGAGGGAGAGDDDDDDDVPDDGFGPNLEGVPDLPDDEDEQEEEEEDDAGADDDGAGD